MTMVWWMAAVGLLLNVTVALVVMLRRGPAADALLAVMLFGTGGVALILLLTQTLGQERAIDIALVLALLAAVLGVAAVRLEWFAEGGRRDLEP
jgi:multicomponent Na+:H+ antiporter subunit F